MAPVLVPVTLVGVVSVFAARLRPVVATLRSRRSTVVGRAVLVVVLVVAMPGFVSSVADILGRGP